MIEGYENFTYEGYTLGGSEPTLYFKEGRYTQVHDNPDNIGWHPISNGDKCIRQNINNQGVERIMEIPEDDAEENIFAQEVLKGKYTPQGTEQATLCELYTADDKNFSIHVSRSKFIRTSDSDFNTTYDQAYAREVLKNGKLAPNEQ